MEDIFEEVHVHSIDAGYTIEEYRAKGFVLLERAAPTIAAQPGFVKLIFVPAEQATAAKHQISRQFWLR